MYDKVAYCKINDYSVVIVFYLFVVLDSSLAWIKLANKNFIMILNKLGVSPRNGESNFI